MFKAALRRIGILKWSEGDLIDAYALILESAEMIEPLDRLPAPKSEIKRALLDWAARLPESKRESVLVAYLSLAQFQDTTLPTLSQSQLSKLAGKPLKEMSDGIHDLESAFRNNAVLTEQVNLERRVLAAEWTAGLALRLMDRTNRP